MGKGSGISEYNVPLYVELEDYFSQGNPKQRQPCWPVDNSQAVAKVGYEHCIVLLMYTLA